MQTVFQRKAVLAMLVSLFIAGCANANQNSASLLARNDREVIPPQQKQEDRTRITKERQASLDKENAEYSAKMRANNAKPQPKKPSAQSATVISAPVDAYDRHQQLREASRPIDCDMNFLGRMSGRSQAC